jgi:hypothetical protein
MANLVLFFTILAAALVVWQARWPQAAFDWLAMPAVGYFIWIATTLHRFELVGVVIFLCVCVSRAELHRNGVAMPRMWWRD